jgi:hypothetical protein
MIASLETSVIRRRQMKGFREDTGLDRECVLVLALGWLAALWITLT